MTDQNSRVLIRIEKMTKSYVQGQTDIPVLDTLDLTVRPKEMVAIMGPSGSGKSTLLFILGLFLNPTQGKYSFAGQDVLALDRAGQARFRRENVGFVFQSTDLLENSNVYENLEFPLMYGGVARRERPDRIVQALEMVKLGHRIFHPANLLSGGERQRAAVARALVNRPQVILADEPTGQLDRANTEMVMDHFARIVSNASTALVMVTHDPEVAARCTRVVHLRDGRVQ